MKQKIVILTLALATLCNSNIALSADYIEGGSITISFVDGEILGDYCDFEQAPKNTSVFIGDYSATIASQGETIGNLIPFSLPVKCIVSGNESGIGVSFGMSSASAISYNNEDLVDLLVTTGQTQASSGAGLELYLSKNFTSDSDSDLYRFKLDGSSLNIDGMDSLKNGDNEIYFWAQIVQYATSIQSGPVQATVTLNIAYTY